MPRVTLKDMRRWYGEFRKLYYADYKLPTASRVKFQWSDLPRDWAQCSVHEVPPVIEVDKSLKVIPDQVRVSLLHELAHLAHPNEEGHGEWFEREQLRLGRLGALREFL